MCCLSCRRPRRGPTLIRYNPTALSRPPDGPWVVTFDDVIEDKEADALTATVLRRTHARTQGLIVDRTNAPPGIMRAAQQRPPPPSPNPLTPSSFSRSFFSNHL